MIECSGPLLCWNQPFSITVVTCNKHENWAVRAGRSFAWQEPKMPYEGFETPWRDSRYVDKYVTDTCIIAFLYSALPYAYIIKALYNAYIAFWPSHVFLAWVAQFSDLWGHTSDHPYRRWSRIFQYMTTFPQFLHLKSYSKASESSLTGYLSQMGSFKCIGGWTPMHWHLSLRYHAKDREGRGWSQTPGELNTLTLRAVPIHLSAYR